MRWVWECRDPECRAWGHNYNEDQVRRESTAHVINTGHSVRGWSERTRNGKA